jgi:archaellum component FlaD/FlaE
MKDPAFLFYTNDFMGGVSDLTMEERGQYITLLCLQHQKGHLSEKIIKLNIGNTTVDVLNKFEKDENGLLYNVRLDVEIEKRRQHSKKQTDNVNKRWNKDKSGNSIGIESGNTMVLPLENENKDVIINEYKDTVFIKPTISEIQNYITEKCYSVDAEKFFNYYDTIGWIVGKAKNKMKNWKTALSGWEKRDKEKSAPTKKQQLPTLEEIMSEKRPEQLKRIFMIEDMEYGGRRPVNMIAIKAANGTYKILWEVFDAD